MLKFRLLLVITGLTYLTTSSAQINLSKNQIGLTTGYSLGAYKNLYLSPVSRYDFNSPFVELNYSRQTKKKRILEFRLKYWNSELESDQIPSLNLMYSNTSLRFDFLYPVMSREKSSLYTGIFSQTTEASYRTSNADLVAGEVQQKFAWATRFNHKLNDKHAFSGQVTIPVLFFVYGNLDFDLYSFKRYQGYNFNLNYHHAFSDKFGGTIGYFSNYDRIQSNNIFRELQNQVTLGIHYNF